MYSTLLIFSDSNETWISLSILEKYTPVKFRENPSSGSRVMSCGRTDGWSDKTDMTKLIVALRKFANAPKKCEVQEYCIMCRMENEILCLWLVILYYSR
jgi:hypothetical protein